MHSATKYLGGHNDLLAGAVLGSQELVDAIRGLQGITGAIVDPFAAYLLVRGLKTFALRMERQNANAAGGGGVPRRATRASRPCTTRGCPPIPSTTSPSGRCAASAAWCRSRCAAISTRPRGWSTRARIPHIAASLGGVESLIEQPAIMSFYELTTEERLEIGIKDNLIRYAVGIEDADDLIADLAQALDRAFAGA